MPEARRAASGGSAQAEIAVRGSELARYQQHLLQVQQLRAKVENPKQQKKPRKPQLNKYGILDFNKQFPTPLSK